MDARFDIEALRPGLDEVDLKCAIFENLPLDPLHPEWIRQRAWVRTVHGTTPIEGNTLSDLEVQQHSSAREPPSARWYRPGPKLLETPAEGETTDPRASERR